MSNPYDSKAAAAARVAQRVSPIWFVYQLLDGDTPFYVGLSKNDVRFKQHVYEARNGEDTPKDDAIRTLLAEGRELRWRKVAENLTKIEARALEAKLIVEQPLTNSHGYGERSQLRARIAVLEKENKRLRALLGKSLV